MVNFDITVHLEAGESLRFVVFSDGQGQDSTYDGTAFRVAIQEVPEPTTAILAMFGVASISACAVARGRRRANNRIRPCD